MINIPAWMVAAHLDLDLRFISKNRRRKAVRRMRNAVRSFRATHDAVFRERDTFLRQSLAARRDLYQVRRWAEALRDECLALRSKIVPYHSQAQSLVFIPGRSKS